MAAVNCDDEANKPFCGRVGVQGFPTLKIVTPSKKPGKPVVEDYRGPRSAKAIADAVVERIPNHVKRLTDKDADGWLSENKDVPKAILFTNKGPTSALLRALAIDFLGGIKFAQVRNKESNAVEKFGVDTFPTLILVPPVGDGEGDKAIKYEGELKKKPMVDFLGEIAAPNPDPAPVEKAKSTTGKKSQSSASASSSGDSTSGETKQPSQAAKIQAPEISSLATPEALETACLAPKSGTCVLALQPAQKDAGTELPIPTKEAVESLAEIAHKHLQRQSKLFPIYSVLASNARGKMLRDSLDLRADETELVVLNARRGWWRKYDARDFGVVPIEAWIDSIRLGEGTKEKLPSGIVAGEAGETEKKQDETHDEL